MGDDVDVHTCVPYYSVPYVPNPRVQRKHPWLPRTNAPFILLFDSHCCSRPPKNCIYVPEYASP